MSFWGELKRRNVFKVGVAYVIVAWLIVQVANTFFPILHLPDWAVTLVAVLVILGFPLALLFAWAFELTPEGLKKTEHVPLEESITHITGRKLNYILISVIVLGVAYLLFDNFYLDKLAIQTEVESRVAELAPPAVEEEEAVPAMPTVDEEKSSKTIAILPFENISSDQEQEYFVDGLTEELLNSLAQIPELTVIARTSSFSFKGTTKKIPEIADELGVANILEGSVRKSGDDLRITAQLVNGADGSHLWSNTYDRELKDTFEVQKEIATAVVEELKVTLGVGESLEQLGGTDNKEAYEQYLIAQGIMQTTVSIETFNLALSSINAAIELDPQFALAWSYKSVIHYYRFVIGFTDKPTNPTAEQDASLSASLRAIELQPTLSEGYAALGNIKATMGEFIEAALAFEKVPKSNMRSFCAMAYIGILQDVAYFKKAQELLEETRQVDLLNPSVRASYIENFGYLGDLEQAEKENERCIALFGLDWMGNLFITNARLGSGQSVTRDQIVVEKFFPSTIHGTAKEYLESPKEGLGELLRFYNDINFQDTADLTSIAFWAAYFGDPELAMDSIEKAISTDTGNINNYWYPLFKEVRQLLRFKKLIREIGIVEYWEKFGWPDICQPTGDGDFVCD